MKYQIVPAFLGVVFASLTFFVFFTIDQKKYEQTPSKQHFSYIDRGIEARTVDQTKSEEAFVDLIQFISRHQGEYGLYIRKVHGEKTYTLRPTRRFYGASLYKVPIAVTVVNEILNEKLSYETELVFTQEYIADGTGSIAHSPVGTTYTISELLKKLLKESDNTAQVMLSSILTHQSLSTTFAELTPLKSTQFYNENTTTPLEYGQLLEALYLSTDNTVLQILSATSFDNRISRGLDKTTVFSHKIGNWPETSTWHDCGVIINKEPTVVCVMSEGTTFEDFLEVTKEVGIFVEQNLLTAQGEPQ